MLVWVIQISLISFIFIFLLHHLYSFFVSTLTVPKIHDLVNSPIQKYQHIFDTIGTNNSLLNSSTNIDLLPTDSDIDDYISPNINTTISNSKNSYLDKQETNMKNELKTFLKKQLHSGGKGNTDYDDNSSVMGFSDTMSVSNYSTF